MFPLPDKSSSTRTAISPDRSMLQRDITWDRPVFRPPQLPSPRVIFDPLPFTAHRLTTPPRAALGH